MKRSEVSQDQFGEELLVAMKDISELSPINNNINQD